MCDCTCVTVNVWPHLCARRVSSAGGSNPNSRRNSEAVRRPMAAAIKESE